MNKKFRSILCIILILVMMVTGCSNGKSGTAKDSDSKDTLNFGLIGEPQILDPTIANEMMAYTIFYQVFDTLVHHKTDGSLVPGLAEKWEISDDGTEITFKLKQGVKFHNGDTMTAEDVVFSYNRAIASKFTQGVAGSMESMKKIDDSTVKLKLKHSYGPIFYCLGSAQMSIVNKKVVEADPEGFSRHPIGTGAYKFVEWKNGDKIICERFDDYYKGKPAIKNINFKIITDSSTAVIALEKGEIDVLDTPPKTDRKNLIENEKIQYHETELAGTVFVGFNNESGIFSNQKLREAVSYAIDKEAMLIGAVEGVGSIIETPMAKVCFGWPEDFKWYPYDPEKAKQLMAEAGYPNGFTTVIKTTESPTYYKPVEVLQEQMRAVGIDAKVEKMERGAFLDATLTNGDYEVTVMAWEANFPDSDYLYFYNGDVTKRKSKNFPRCNIPELNELLERGRTSSDQEDRKKIYRDVCEIIKKEAITVPLYSYMTGIAANKDLNGVEASPTNRYFIYDYSWK